MTSSLHKASIEKKKLTDALRKTENNFLRLMRRFYFLDEYNNVIESNLEDAKNKVSVRNDLIQQLILDTYDMLINDFVSFCEGATQSGGILELMKQGTSHFKLRTAEDFSPPDITFLSLDPISQDELEKQKAEAVKSYKTQLIEAQQNILQKMFPSTKHRNDFAISPKDINLLIREFKNLYKAVKKYRNGISAHRYEKGDKSVKAPTITEIGILLEKTQSLMNQIRVILENSSLAYRNMFQSSAKETAKDLLDLLVCGGSKQVRLQFGVSENNGSSFEQLRDSFYETIRNKNKLHE